MTTQDKSKFVVREIENPKRTTGIRHFLFHCPGCKTGHSFDDKIWKFDYNMESPTLSPSYLVYENKEYRKKSNDRYGHRCHSFIKNGKIQFLSDCTHSLAGKTVDLEPV